MGVPKREGVPIAVRTSEALLFLGLRPLSTRDGNLYETQESSDDFLRKGVHGRDEALNISPVPPMRLI